MITIILPQVVEYFFIGTSPLGRFFQTTFSVFIVFFQATFPQIFIFLPHLGNYPCIFSVLFAMAVNSTVVAKRIVARVLLRKCIVATIHFKFSRNCDHFRSRTPSACAPKYE